MQQISYPSTPTYVKLEKRDKPRYAKRQKVATRFIVRVGKAIAPKMHTFRQTYIPSSSGGLTITGGSGSYNGSDGGLSGPDSATATDAFFAIQWLLSQLPQYTSFTTLFDQYRLEKCRFVFRPLLGQTNIPANIAAENMLAYPQPLDTVIDYDDNTPLTSYNACLEYSSFRRTNYNQKHVRTIRPKPTAAYYSTGAFSGYGAADRRVNPWLDCQSVAIPHYGIKGHIPSFGASGNIQTAWILTVDCWISFKNVR